MADDIDELLDEVESKFIDPENRLSDQIASSSHHKTCITIEDGGVAELDVAINSICSIPEPVGVSSVNPAALQITAGSKRKCTVLYVGGTHTTSSNSTPSNSSQRRNTPKKLKQGTKISTKKYFTKPVFELSIKDLEAETARRRQKEVVETLFEKKLAVVTDKMILDVRKFKRIKSDVWSNFGDVRLLISEIEAKKYNIDFHIIQIGEDEMLLCKSFVACVKCFAVFSYESHSYGTSTLRAHLKSCGKPRYNMKEKRYQMLRLKRSLSDVIAPPPVNTIKPSIELLEPYHDVKPVFHEHMVKFRDHSGKLQDQILLFLLSKLKPLETIADKEFQKLLQTFIQIGAHSGDVDAKLFLPSKTELSNNLLQEAYTMSENAFKDDVQHVYGLAFSAEIWVDAVETSSYISFFCHYANDVGVLKSVILLTSEFPYEQKSHEDVTYLLSECLRFMGLEHICKLFIVDYSYNMVTAVERDFSFLQCICYSVSRSVQSVINQLTWNEDNKDDDDPFALPSFPSLINQCRTLVSHFKENKLQNNLPKYLVMCSSTCWKATLNMLQSINNQWDHIMDVLQEREELGLFSFDQELLSIVVDFLELYRDGCEELSSLSSPTLNMVVPWLNKWQRHCNQNDEESPFLASLKSHMSSAIQEEVVERITIHHKLATMLDPRFKELHFLSKEDQENARQQAITMVTECKNASLEALNSAKNSFITALPKDHFADLYANISSENDDKYSTPDKEVDSYLADNFVMRQQDLDIENKFNPLKYWTRNKDKYPYLSQVALWLLACPASAIREREMLTHNWTVVYRDSGISPSHMHSCKFVKSFRNL